MPLDSTVGGADANSFASLAEYRTYWGNRLYNTAAMAASDPVATQALMWSCLIMSAAFKWTGSAVNNVQALPWPRNGMLSLNNFPIDPTTNPKALKDAQCEFAGALLKGDRTADNPNLKQVSGESNLTSLKVGPVSFSFAGGHFNSLEDFDAYIRSLGSNFAYISKAIPDSVRMLIPPSWYLEGQLKRPVLFVNH